MSDNLPDCLHDTLTLRGCISLAIHPRDSGQLGERQDEKGFFLT